MRTFLRRYHLIMMGVWPVLAIPAVLWWKESIIFVILLSLYANFGADFSAYQAARAEESD
jgi:hypothetical protein